VCDGQRALGRCLKGGRPGGESMRTHEAEGNLSGRGFLKKNEGAKRGAGREEKNGLEPPAFTLAGLSLVAKKPTFLGGIRRQVKCARKWDQRRVCGERKGGTSILGMRPYSLWTVHKTTPQKPEGRENE